MSWQEAASINLQHKLLSSDDFDPWSWMLHLGPGSCWIQFLQDKGREWVRSKWGVVEENSNGDTKWIPLHEDRVIHEWKLISPHQARANLFPPQWIIHPSSYMYSYAKQS